MSSDPDRLGPYRVERRLGAGTHGTAYVAWDTELLRRVVLKLLKGDGDRARSRMLREARLSSAIEHPNVCAIYGVAEEHGQPFIVMQYVVGRPLSEVLKGGPLSLPLALSIGVQIADGLAAAHELGIVHRDLKPANIMVTESGLVKILDFGLAVRRARSEGEGTPAELVTGTPSGPMGSTGYMAPELFARMSASEKSDVFALGVALYFMTTGHHPYEGNAGAEQLASAIQFSSPLPPSSKRELPKELDRLIASAMARSPANRIDSASSLADGLRSVLRLQRLASDSTPGHPIAPLPTQTSSGRRPGFIRALAELVWRPRPSGRRSLAVLPFVDSRASRDGIDVGLALADVLAARLANLPDVEVRRSGSLLSREPLPADPLQAGDALGVTHVLSGSLTEANGGLLAAWQLVRVDDGAVIGGDSLEQPSLDLVALQKQVADQVSSRLRAANQLQGPESNARELPPELAEDYLSARALLSGFVLRTRRRRDLDRAAELLRATTEGEPSFAPALSALGIAELHYARNGYGDQGNVRAARDAFERAIAIDPTLTEAKLFRVYTFLALGDKESARHAVVHLLETASGIFDVHVTAANVLRLDGIFDASLAQLSLALAADPNHAHVVYNQRARLYHYQGELDAALSEIERGLALVPNHPLLRTSLGYLQLRKGKPDAAVAALAQVVSEEPTLGLIQPTLAAALHLAGDDQRGRALITPALIAAAECDPETAYRLATYFAVSRDDDEALLWLNRAIYLGNENQVWFAENPLWAELGDDRRLQAILEALAGQQERHRRFWRRVL